MAEQQSSHSRDRAADDDPTQLNEAFANIAERSAELVTHFLTRHGPAAWARHGAAPVPFDPLNIGSAFLEMTARLASNPTALAEAQVRLWQGYMDLWHSTARRMLGQEAEPVVAPSPDDRRFKDPSWNDNPLFDYVKQSYLLSAKWLQETVRDIEGLDDRTAQRVDFYTRQFVDAMAPTNFALTNPEVLRETLESRGENLVRGLENLLEDLAKGEGKLRISQTDEDAFEVGRNLAVTDGAVVFRNELMELIQYAPTTEEVARRPLLIVPPWINKYYILDLAPEKSFIAWCVGQGLTVFTISWVNPDARLAEKTFEDYMTEGFITALDVVAEITGEAATNVAGYCIGGTLLAAALRYLAAIGDARVKSATFLTAMIDFAEAGELGVFIDEEQLTALEAQMDDAGGYLDGAAMANTFNMLRANDLIWSFVVNNYLLGKDPFPFDLLYWNADSTRMPAAMHSYYLRNMYQRNLLAEPGGLTLGGQPIDLSKVKTPSFFLSTKEDHIAPWQSTYHGMRLLGGPKRFCLAGSGHIAGVVNPPAAEKYFHWENAKTPADPDAWLEGATKKDGSWWPAWRRWLKTRDGGKVAARAPGGGGYRPLAKAPGRYVLVRSDERA